ncbi:MAG: hypothetical protein WC238_04690 [Parcubacteria group bacterium]
MCVKGFKDKGSLLTPHGVVMHLSLPEYLIWDACWEWHTSVGFIPQHDLVLASVAIWCLY